MLVSRVLGFVAFALLFWPGGAGVAIAQGISKDAKPAEKTERTEQTSAAQARLVFTHAEPFQQPVYIRGQQVDIANLKMWFKNEGQAPAHLLTVGAMSVLSDKPLTETQEENDLKAAATEWSVKASAVVEPGQGAFFAGQAGIDEVGWADFQAKRNFLYSFVTLSYRSGDSESGTEIVTEACVWFQSADIKTANPCESGHNRVFQTSKD